MKVKSFTVGGASLGRDRPTKGYGYGGPSTKLGTDGLTKYGRKSVEILFQEGEWHYDML